MLGREVNDTDLANAQALLAGGGTLAQVRASVAASAEALADFAGTYAAIGAAPPTAAENAAFSAVMAASYDAPIKLVGRQGILAETSAIKLLVELPVLETLDSGRTLSLGLPDGSQLTFQDTAHLTNSLFAVASQKSQADSFITDTYHADLTWLDTVDQPMLNVAENLSDLAAYNAGRGATDQATLDNAASRVALTIAAAAPGSRPSQLSEKVSLPSHQTQVTVFANTLDPVGGTIFHDIDPGVGVLPGAVGSYATSPLSPNFGPSYAP